MLGLWDDKAVAFYSDMQIVFRLKTQMFGRVLLLADLYL